MSRAHLLAAAVVLFALASRAQDASARPLSAAGEPGTPASSRGPSATPLPLAPSADSVPGGLADEPARRDLEERLEAARREVRELRDELRARLATQAATSGWQAAWSTEKRGLELLTLNGAFRVRPELFHRFDLNRPADPAGFVLWPRPHTSGRVQERTQAGVNMRLRIEPTINVSESLRLRMQVDALDNLVWGSTPDYAASRDPRRAFDRDGFSVLSGTQVPPRSGVNALADSLAVKRAWGEIELPFGILRLGRMGSHWGLGMLYNDGNGLDADFGSTVDRVMLTSEVLEGFYVSPMLDVRVAGPSIPAQAGGGQPVDLSHSDDAVSLAVAASRRETDDERRSRLATGKGVLEYGLHFEYRMQRKDSFGFLRQAFTGSTPSTLSGDAAQWSMRGAHFFTPDVWARYERKAFRIEAEAAAIMGSMSNRSLSAADAALPGQKDLAFWQFGAVVQGEYRFLNGDLEVGGEVGFASGDKDPGFGNYPARTGSGPGGLTAPGDIDGPQYACSAVSCAAGGNAVRNFRFHRDYRVDMILYRELLGGITDSLYLRPVVRYRVSPQLSVQGAAVYARAIYGESTPSAARTNDGSIRSDPNLGIELNAGATWQSTDGFFAKLQYGILFPLPGLGANVAGTTVTLENAQAIRGAVGIRF